MKSKPAIDLLRWVGQPLLLASLIAWSIAPAYPGNVAGADIAAQKQHAGAASAKTASDASDGIQEIKDRLRELESKERQNYALELEGRHKRVDWWLSFLGVILAGLAIFVAVAGIAIPYAVVRKNRDIIEQDKKIIEQDKAQVRAWLDEIEKLKHKANADAEVIGQKLEIVSGTPSATSEDVQQTAKTTAQDKTADPILRLRAKAVEASRSESAREAYTLWAALAELTTSDANAQFNAGYWAYQLGDRAQADEKMHWLKLAGQHFARALAIKPDLHEAVYSLGVVLGAEADALSAQDMGAARPLWQQAGEKYRQVLAIKPGKHEAANNWGAALAAEAGILSTLDLAAARALWQQAGEKYRQTLAIKPDKHEAANNWGTALIAEAGAIAERDAEQSKRLLDQAEQLLLAHADAAPGKVAYNLACVYGRRADVQNCLKWLGVSQKHNTLKDCTYLREDKDLDEVRNAPEFVEWLRQVCP